MFINNQFCTKNIKCVQLNARSIINKLNLFILKVFSNDFDIVCVTESRSRADMSESLLSIPGYILFRGDIFDRRSGGTALHVKKCFQPSAIERINDTYEDITGFKLNVRTGKTLTMICVCPNQTHSN